MPRFGSRVIVALILFFGASVAAQRGVPPTPPSAQTPPSTPGASTGFRVDRIDPLAAGMSAERLARIAPRMKEFVDSGKTAGVVTLVARHGHVASLDAVGFQDLAKKTPMTRDTIFRIMSVSKPITAAGIMVLVDEGRLSLLDPVEKFIPEFRGIRVNPCGTLNGFDCQLAPPARPFTVLDLLTHTSGRGEAGAGRGGGPAPSRAPSHRDDRPADDLAVQPGTRWHYTNFGIGVLGRVIEVASGQPLTTS
jgi:CubicO group peptidase (beta-lactamase class C family)